MAKISLRVYNREIEGMIEGGQLDEAIAHCYHILKTFPMHVETYRLLGKAFLEGRRYADATDIFQRILNAVPDDFVAHVGMSIIRDDESKLDEAIWHMERAFQVQPSNAAIQNELRRLYGRRDGIEPPKIRLSRDALANMYAQGDLFVQAIAEIRSILADDPSRPDLQAMLSRACLRAGQKVEAADHAAQLLKKYPYCMDALRVLVEVLPGTARAENTQVYRQRLVQLDPYSAFATGSVFLSDQVADAAVNLDRLDYQPGKQATPSQPAWAASLGVKIEDEKRDGLQPAWLTSGGAELPPEPTPPVPGASSGAARSDESIPDFLRAAGWGASSGDFTEGPAEPAEEPPAEQIEKGEMPDWLKSIAPADLPTEDEPVAESAPAEGGDLPDWLAGLGFAAGEASLPDSSAGLPAEAQPEPEKPVEAEPFLEVQSEAVVEEEVSPEAPSEPIAETGEAKPLGIEDDTMAWLESLAAKQGAKSEELLTRPEERSEELPDWLKGVAEAQPELEKPIEAEPFLEVQSEAVVEEEVSPEAPSEPIAETGEAKPLGIEDDTTAWLESLVAKQGAKSEELLTRPEERSEELPDWLKGVAEAQPEPEKPVEAEPFLEVQSEAVVEEEVSPEAPSEPIAETGEAKPLGIEDDTMAWLEALAAKQGAKSEELLTRPEERSGVMPEWLQQSASAAETPAATIPESAPEAPPASLEETVFAAESPAGEAEKAPAPAESGQPAAEVSLASWLENLDEAAPAPKGETPFASEPPAAAAEEFPDWLKDLEKQPSHSEEAALQAGDLPDWLHNLPGSALERPTPPPAAEPGPPAWVVDETALVEQPAPTVSGEWVPEEKVKAGQEAALEQPRSEELPAITLPHLPKATGMLAPVPEKNKDAVLLSEAQRALEAGLLAESMTEYAKLVRKNRLMEETIHDLREALYRFPVDSIIWQTLGDAYMRAGRLQDALDAYTKAEELLR